MSKPAILCFLDQHNILWQPLADMKVNDGKKEDYNPDKNKRLFGYTPMTNDFKKLDVSEIKKRQKKYTKSNTIAIDTSEIVLIDCDKPDIPEEILRIQRISPYFLSYAKGLPKIFVKVKNVVKKNTKLKFDKMEIQTGQWSYAKLDSKINNYDAIIPEIDISSWLIENTKEKEIKNILKKLDDCYCDERNKWWRVGNCIKKELGEEGWNVFDEWSKNCEDKYDETKNKTIWDAIEVKDTMNMNTLKKYAKTDNKDEKDEVSDAIIADMFVNLFPNIKASNQSFFIFKNHRWNEISKTALKALVSKDFVDKLAIQLTETDNDDKRKFILKAIKFISSYNSLKNVVSYIEPKIYDEKLYENFDSNEFLIGFNNGVYDLKNHEFRDGKQEDYISITTNYDYSDVETSKMQMWNTLLSEIFPNPEVVTYFKQVMASTLCGDKKFENFYFHTGRGGNGKGVLGDIMIKVFGEYYSSMSSSQLTIASRNKNEASPELANKKGKRLCISTELEEGQVLQIGAIKQWSGGDVISTRALYKNAIEFKPQFTLNIQTNDLPEIKKIDESVIRRVRVIDYPMSFVNNPSTENERKLNPELKTIIKEDSELWNAVIHDLLEVFKDVSKMTEIVQPLECRKATEKYLDSNDLVKTWFDEKLVKKIGSGISASGLYEDYRNYVGYKDPKLMSATLFARLMNERFHLTKKKTNKGLVYENIGWIASQDEDGNENPDFIDEDD